MFHSLKITVSLLGSLGLTVFFCGCASEFQANVANNNWPALESDTFAPSETSISEDTSNGSGAPGGEDDPSTQVIARFPGSATGPAVELVGRSSLSRLGLHQIEVTPSLASDFMLQDVCVDQNNQATFQDPYVCASHRNLRVGEDLP